MRVGEVRGRRLPAGNVDARKRARRVRRGRSGWPMFEDSARGRNRRRDGRGRGRYGRGRGRTGADGGGGWRRRTQRPILWTRCLRRWAALVGWKQRSDEGQSGKIHHVGHSASRNQNQAHASESEHPTPTSAWTRVPTQAAFDAAELHGRQPVETASSPEKIECFAFVIRLGRLIIEHHVDCLRLPFTSS